MILKRIFVVCSGILSISTAICSSPIYSSTMALGETLPNGSPSSVMVRVRAIKAVTTAPSGELQETKSIDYERSLSDIKAKLKKLPFKSFSLVSSQSENIPMMRKETIFLVGGNALTIRPLYAEDGKVGLWIRWIDGSGAKVLDTRMHLVSGESMVAGADAGDQVATVLAIDVTPSNTAP